MSLDIASKIRAYAKNWFFWLMIILAIAIILRSIPAWNNAAWGGDFWDLLWPLKIIRRNKRII